MYMSKKGDLLVLLVLSRKESTKSSLTGHTDTHLAIRESWPLRAPPSSCAGEVRSSSLRTPWTKEKRVGYFRSLLSSWLSIHARNPNWVTSFFLLLSFTCSPIPLVFWSLSFSLPFLSFFLLLASNSYSISFSFTRCRSLTGYRANKRPRSSVLGVRSEWSILDSRSERPPTTPSPGPSCLRTT